MARAQRVQLVSVVILATAICASAEVRKEFRFTVGPGSVISITNQYGPISVKPGAAARSSWSPSFIPTRSRLTRRRAETAWTFSATFFPPADAEAGRVDYEVSVPADASVTLRSFTGLLHAEGLHGDVTLEGSQANVEVRDVSDAHVHVRTLNGSVALTNIRNGHVEVTSVERRRGVELGKRPPGAGELDQRQDPL